MTIIKCGWVTCEYNKDEICKNKKIELSDKTVRTTVIIEGINQSNIQEDCLICKNYKGDY